MITIAPGYQSGERWFPTIEEAQKEELLSLLVPKGQVVKSEAVHDVIDSIIRHSDEVIAILTCQPKVKTTRKQRSDIGKKRGKKDATPAVI